MAAMSANPTVSTLTPPSSSHGTGTPWNMSVSEQAEKPIQSKAYSSSDPPLSAGRQPLEPQSGNSTGFAFGGDAAADTRGRAAEPGYLSPPYRKDLRPGAAKDSGSPADSLLDLYGSNRSDATAESHKRPAAEGIQASVSDDESSKWIHRDKLARIENEELQAAGIVLPRQRARSKSQNRTKRDESREPVNTNRTTADQLSLKSRKNSAAPLEPRTPDAASVPSWDLRLPEEVAADEPFWVSAGGPKGGSRIPVAKLSPVPLPTEHIERDTPIRRRRESSPGAEDSISYQKTRSRSNSITNALEKATTNGSTATQGAKRSAADTSPKKAASTRKGSAPPSTVPKPANGAAGRPKTRGGPSKDSTSSGTANTRPSTRSGERELSGSNFNKAPEGEPPWMVSAYRPDPRLPPDQQLLPTVARRLQQEKWEKEGKFGGVYDTSFRPLSGEGLLNPPDRIEKPASPVEQQVEKSEDWPLKAEQRSPMLSPARTGSYSTMPKIADKASLSPLPSPRPQSQPRTPQATQLGPVIRVPDTPEVADEKKKGGCGCCLVM